MSEQEPPEAEESLETHLAEHGHHLLPAWFTERMLGDSWTFGLLLTTGVTLVIESISNITAASDGSLWLDVNMHTEQEQMENGLLRYIFSPTERTKATINAAHIVAAFELADT